MVSTLSIVKCKLSFSEDSKKEKESHLETQKKNDDLEKQLLEVKSELGDIKAAVAFSESNKEAAISDIRRQCQQEVETLQQLLKGMV